MRGTNAANGIVRFARAKKTGATPIWLRLFPGAVLASLISASLPAQASVEFCNKLPDDIIVAIAYSPKDAPGTSTGGDLATTTEGWWTVNPGKCETVSQVNAASVWLYEHTITKDGRIAGTSMLCVKSHASFKVDERFGKEGDKCQEGWNLRGFRRLDADKTNWTINVK
jgi:uncharacterized membrane protein